MALPFFFAQVEKAIFQEEEENVALFQKLKMGAVLPAFILGMQSLN